MHSTPTKSSFLLLLASLVIGVVGLSGSACQAPEQPVHLTILATTDFHGALESSAKDPESGRPLGGAPFLAAVIERERQENPTGTILLDGGDIFQGTALSNLTEGRATIDYMNVVGFDAAAVGNHDFDWGVATLQERMAQAEFPILCANVVSKETGDPPAWATPYHIEQRLGLRIAVVGVVTPDTPRVTLPANVAHLDFLDPVEAANRWIEELVPEQADLAVIVTHIGGFLADGEIQGNIVDLAEGVENEVAIAGGHTHQLLSGVHGGTVLLQGGNVGRAVARADLFFDRGTKQVVESTTELVSVFSDAIEPQERIVAIVDDYRDQIGPVLDEVVGEAAVELSTSRDECPMGNLMVDIIRDAAQTDVAFHNAGGIRGFIGQGPIRYADVYRVMPFDNTIAVVPLTGRELARLLEEAVRGGSFLHVSGLSYVADYSRPAYSRVSDIRLPDDSELDPERTYTVAINNFLAAGGDDLPAITKHPKARETGIVLREAMADWMRAETESGRTITSAIEGRVERRNR